MLKHSLIILLMAFTAGFAVQSRAGGSMLPDIPAAQARFSETQGCMEPTEDMRKNHMEYILHKRDETMYRGIRSSRHSLVECINCHVSDDPDAPRVSSEEHFCNSCHTYAAVSIDCFQCHADRPVKTGQHQTVSAGSTGHPRILASEGIAHE
jgi:hypothetical protein